MLCIFCKEDACASRSVEHIIPESLGNTTLLLPPGIVCDKCNNYFARKIEKPLLESDEVYALRFHQRVPNKRGIIPALAGTIGHTAPVLVQLHDKGPFGGSMHASPEALDLMFNHNADVLNLPGFEDTWDRSLAARFLAKVALEAIASRLINYPAGLHSLATDPQLDLIRSYARRGDGVPWPFYSRRIYPADKLWLIPDGSEVQRVHENEFLSTDDGECYFILALFGLELTINIGGRSIDGYLNWLACHANASPLYFGRNANRPEDGK